MEDPPQSPTGVNLPNPAAQSYIHQLAKTLPAPRKQNSACDACRSRKVKCNRADGEEKCQHCLSKNYPCTNYVQQATVEKKRTTGVQRRPRGISQSHASSTSAPYPRPPYTQVEGRVSDFSSSSYQDRDSPLSSSPGIQPFLPAFKDGLDAPPITSYTSTVNLLAYLFAPPVEASQLAHLPLAQQRSIMYGDWGDHATKLDDPTYRAEFALDLVEVFFQIVHTRWPLLNPDDFRTRLRLPGNGQVPHALAQGSSHQGGLPSGYPSPAPSSPPSTGSPPLHPGIVAAVLAWGAKFSEHQLLVADRRKNGGQGRLPKILIDRARDVAEALKVHRIPSPDHILVGLLLEPLQNQNPEIDTGYQGFWLAASVRHLIALQYNHKSVVAQIQDAETRGIMIFAWWMATLCDGYSSAYYRRKPLLDDEDYDIDFYTADPLVDGGDLQAAAPTTREQLEFLGYYRANHALARIARVMSKNLWRPASEAEGIPYAILCDVVTSIHQWRDQYLHQVGVPPNSAANWDFISAISACASDATYHVMWIILFNAVDEFGIREINQLVRNNHPAELAPQHQAIEAFKQKLMDEALHGSLRISGLAGVLASNGYLRLDPAVMHISCIQAGTLLARLGRPEVSNCVAALQQYGYAYEEAAEQGQDIERVYAIARSGESDIGHMASTIARSMSPDGGRV